MGRMVFDVITAAGALATTVFTGNPLLGAAVYAGGQTLNQLVFYPLAFPQHGPTVVGPRLADLQNQTALYGTFKPRGYGKVRVPGRLIWMNDGKLDEHVHSTGSGVKGGNAQSTTFTYTMSAAYAFLEGPVQNFLRFWGDNKLFWQWDGSANVQEKYPGVVGFHLGHDAELPDPVIEASGSGHIVTWTVTNGGGGYLGGDTGGIGGGNFNAGYQVINAPGGHVTELLVTGGSGYQVGQTYPLNRGGQQPGNGHDGRVRIDSVTSALGNVPAFRSTAYAVFDQLPLQDFANHAPLISAEVVCTNSPITVGDIVKAECRRVGLTDDEMDTSLLTQEVVGYMVGRRMSARAAIQVLQDLFLFDGVESQGRLVWVPRGQSPVLRIPATALSAHDPQSDVPPPVEFVHSQEVEQPERVEVIYLDAWYEYQQKMQYGARAQAPQPTQFSRQRLQIDAPVVMDPGLASTQAHRILYNRWLERDKITFTTSQAYLHLNPGDVVQLHDGSRLYTVRLTSVDIGIQGLLVWQAVKEDQTVYDITIEPPPPPPPPPPPEDIPPVIASTLFVVDTAIYRAEDNDTGLYLAVTGADSRWRGAQAVRSADQTTWDTAANFALMARVGHAATVLGPFPANVWDYANTVDVTMLQGTLESYTRETVLAGHAPTGVLGDEQIQWQSATQLTADTWRLATLLRGRRGTEWATASHAVGEQFVVLEPEAVQRYAAPATDLEALRYYKAISVRQLLEDATTIPVTNHGRGQRCYAPVHIHGTRDVTGNLTITWRRRTRLPWETFDGLAGPLGENVESYRVYIYAATGGGGTFSEYWDMLDPDGRIWYVWWDALGQLTLRPDTPPPPPPNNLLSVGPTPAWHQVTDELGLVWWLQPDNLGQMTLWTSQPSGTGRVFGPGIMQGLVAYDALALNRYAFVVREGQIYRDLRGATPSALVVTPRATGTIIRTLTAATPQVVYSLADQTTDFGGAATDVVAAVVQVNAYTGDGYPGEVIL